MELPAAPSTRRRRKDRLLTLPTQPVPRWRRGGDDEEVPAEDDVEEEDVDDETQDVDDEEWEEDVGDVVVVEIPNRFSWRSNHQLVVSVAVVVDVAAA